MRIGVIFGYIRYYIFKFENWIWKKTSISLPLWRHYKECDAILLQEELDWQHEIRDEWNAKHNENLSTRQVMIAKLGNRRERHPLIIQKEHSLFKAK